MLSGLGINEESVFSDQRVDKQKGSSKLSRQNKFFADFLTSHPHKIPVWILYSLRAIFQILIFQILISLYWDEQF